MGLYVFVTKYKIICEMKKDSEECVGYADINFLMFVFGLFAFEGNILYMLYMPYDICERMHKKLLIVPASGEESGSWTHYWETFH